MALGVKEDVAPSPTDIGLLRLIGVVAQAEIIAHRVQTLPLLAISLCGESDASGSRYRVCGENKSRAMWDLCLDLSTSPMVLCILTPHAMLNAQIAGGCLGWVGRSTLRLDSDK